MGSQTDSLCQASHMLTLGQDRALVAMDLLDRPASSAGSFFARVACTDQCLDITGPQPAVDLDLKLSKARPIAPDGSP